MAASFTALAKSCEVLDARALAAAQNPREAQLIAKFSLAASALTLALAASLCSPRGVAAEGAKPPGAAAAPAIEPQVLAKVVPGISKSQVKSLLGDPWRTVQYNDEEEIENEIWEYRGQDAHGPYRVHIEFDRHETVVIVGKIPDKVASGKGTPAKS
jgi:hypothetical protein